MSIYRRNNNVVPPRTDYYEVGQYWQYKWGQPKWFWAKMINNSYNGPNFWINGDPGETRLLSVQIEGNGKVQMKVDSNILKEETSVFYPDGLVFWAAERQSLTDTNYGSFLGLMKRAHDYSWGNWLDHRAWPIPSPNLPDPGFHWYSPSETNGYSVAN